MSTIVNSPASERERVVESDSGGWAVAVIVLLAIVAIGGFFLMRYYGAPAATTPVNTESNTPGSANINVTLPANTDNGGNTGGTGGGTGGTGGTGGGSTPTPTPQ